MNNLKEKAMLVDLQISQWTGRTKDSKVTNEVQNAKNAEDGSGAWWTYLIPKTSLKAIDQAVGRCRTEHNKRTLPWNNNGTRILSSMMFMEYSQEMRKLRFDYDLAVENFLKEYPIIVASTQKRLGKLFDNKRMPDVREIKNKFGCCIDIMPMPDAGDFRVELGNDEVNDIKKQITSSIEQMTENAMFDLWRQLNELISKMAETLSKPEKIFRDTLVTNIKDFCELVPKLNITGNQKLEDFRKEAIEKLTKLNPEDLRTVKGKKAPKARAEAAKVAKEMLAKIKEHAKK